MLAQLDVGWRNGEPIDILVNPNGPKEVESVLDNPRRKELTALGRVGRFPYIRFGVNSLGILWVADSLLAMHGDESRGKIIPSTVSKGSRADTLLSLGEVPNLLYGSICIREKWELEVHTNKIDVYSLNSARIILEQLLMWRRAVKGTNLEPSVLITH